MTEKQMATITIYQPDGTHETEEREPSDRPGLRELQKAVGDGLIQPVDQYLTDGSTAYANEEGLLLNMGMNIEGAKAVQWPHPLVGPIVVLKGFDPEEEE